MNRAPRSSILCNAHEIRHIHTRNVFKEKEKFYAKPMRTELFVTAIETILINKAQTSSVLFPGKHMDDYGFD